MSALYDDALKADLQSESRMLRQMQRQLLAVLDRCERAATQRSLSVEQALVLTKQQVREYFVAEIGARRVGC